mmetsp:Transcript_14722/g.37441  ORF Transcript_14722/g.37441 Transcript_14722/m.37441 type:complete len:223 (+) Transcript_14722:141-809(+)
MLRLEFRSDNLLVRPHGIPEESCHVPEALVAIPELVEVVDEAVVRIVLVDVHVHPVGHQAGAIAPGFVPEHVEVTDLDVRPRHPGQNAVVCHHRRHANVFAVAGGSDVGLGEELHRPAGKHEEGIVAELDNGLVLRPVGADVKGREEQELKRRVGHPRRRRVRCQVLRQNSRKVATRRIASDGDVCRVPPVVVCCVHYPVVRGDSIVDRGREGMLGSEAVVH